MYMGAGSSSAAEQISSRTELLHDIHFINTIRCLNLKKALFFGELTIFIKISHEQFILTVKGQHNF